MASTSDSDSRFLRWNFPTFKGWSGNIGWPILLKELRADFRKNRFFLTHSICLTAIAIGILGKVWFQSQEAGVTSVQLGRELFNAFFMIQYFIVLVVFPAFTATAFTEERSRGSFDLLMTTDLRPAEVVLGKFQATSIYCLITVFATIPLLAVSTLFGGVQFEEILAAYGILIGLTVIMSMLGVFFSSCFKSNLPSTLAVYFVVCLVLIYTYYKWDDISLGMEESGGETIVGMILKELRGFTGAEAGSVAGAGAIGSPSLFEDSAIWGVLILGLFLFSYLFLLTTNRIRPASDDRASKLRALTMLFVVGWVAKGCLEALWYARQMDYDVVFRYVWTTFVLLFGVALLFATESLNLSRRLRAQFSRLSGPKYPLRIFTPGSFWGLMYLIAMLLVATAGLYFIWMQSSGAMEAYDRDRLQELILTMPIYLFAFGALGFFLASWGFTHGYNFLTVFFIFIITLLLPVIFKMANRPDSVFYCYYLSPFTLYESLVHAEENFAATEDGPKFVLFGGVPIILVAKFVFGGLGVAFLTAGSLFAKRENYPLARLQ